MNNLNDNMPAILAIIFVFVYAIIQLYVIYHPDAQDDLISIRVQDIMMIVMGYYFVSSNRPKT